MEIFTFVYPGGRSCCEVIQFIPYNNSLFIFNWPNNPAQLINIKTRKTIIQIPQNHVCTTAVPPSGKSILMGTSDGDIEIWDLAMMKTKYYKHQYHTDCISKTLFVNEDLIVTSSYDGNIRLQDIRMQKQLENIECWPEGIRDITYQKDQYQFAVTRKNAVLLWDIRRFGETIRMLETPNNYRVQRCEFHQLFPNMLVASCSSMCGNHFIGKWNLRVQQYQKQDIKGIFGSIQLIQLFKDSEQIIYSNDKRIHILGEECQIKLQNRVTCMQLDNSDKYLAVGFGNGNVKIFDINKWNKRQWTMFIKQ